MTGPRSVPHLDGPVDVVVRPPGSKSETIRALAIAALADGRSHIYAPLDAEDPRAMSGALRALGVDVSDGGDPWAVDGRAGRLMPPDGPLDANESGLSARILLAMTGSIDGVSRIEGRGRLPQRPMKGIVDVLRSQGVEVSGEHLPLDVVGRGHLWGGRLQVDCTESSQFATALMLVAPIMHESAVIELTGLSGSAGYLDMTEAMMQRFGADVVRTVTGYEIANTGYLTADVVVEPDASAAVYPMAIAAITGGRVVVEGLGQSSRQPDLEIASILGAMGCRVEWSESSLTVEGAGSGLDAVDVDMSQAPDGALALAVTCLFAKGTSRISGLGSLRHKESDRLEAISSEIRRIGGEANLDGDTLVVGPGNLRGADIDPHGDHRIAMALATAGTRIEGLRMMDPSVVKKTWPAFWDFLESLVSG